MPVLPNASPLLDQFAAKARLEKIMSGASKPANEAEGIQAMAAMMWKKAFEAAMKPMDSESQDALSAPQAGALRDRQATWMGIEAASSLSESLTAQLAHAREMGAGDSSKR
jgi:hypothetical protein